MRIRARTYSVVFLTLTLLWCLVAANQIYSLEKEVAEKQAQLDARLETMRNQLEIFEPMVKNTQEVKRFFDVFRKQVDKIEGEVIERLMYGIEHERLVREARGIIEGNLEKKIEDRLKGSHGGLKIDIYDF